MDKPELFNRELLDFLEDVWGAGTDIGGDHKANKLENWA